MAQTFKRSRFTWLAYLLLAYYSYYLNILGPITPLLKDELKLSYTVSSLHFSAFAAGILLVGLGGYPVAARLGSRLTLWLGAFGMSAGVLLLISGRTPVLTISAAFLMGLVGSLIMIIVNSGLSDEHGEQRTIALSEANVIASLVAAAAPLVVGVSLRTSGGWRPALGFVLLALVLLFLGFGKLTPPMPARSAQTANDQSLPVVFWVYILALLLGVAVEFCMISWSADFFETGLGVPQARAAQTVSLFLAGMILGRFGVSRLVSRFTATQLVSNSILLAGVGFLIYWLAGSPLPAMAGLFITGLGVAGLFPLLMALSIGSAGGNATLASARATFAAGLAILTLPLTLGRLADSFGIRSAYGVVGLLLAAVFVIVQFSRTQARVRLPVVE